MSVSESSFYVVLNIRLHSLVSGCPAFPASVDRTVPEAVLLAPVGRPSVHPHEGCVHLPSVSVLMPVPPFCFKIDRLI